MELEVYYSTGSPFEGVRASMRVAVAVYKPVEGLGGSPKGPTVHFHKGVSEKGVPYLVPL